MPTAPAPAPAAWALPRGPAPQSAQAAAPTWGRTDTAIAAPAPGASLPAGVGPPRPAPPAVPAPGERGAMTGRGSPSRFLTAVLHNGVGRYVRQLQRLQLLFSPTAADARGASERHRAGRAHCQQNE
ncbi:39S ribosomal protein L43, mitochondrial isoform X2 [Passer montanus]|uniref:39S ribosomal protein L43, mitochondrial isoform X2 n=1 Tax=Passer montanus TaxID=9160 RepID=UPI001960D913|nr:39S ribosomal protein L43, mitochondrial isoform X2 [Passer montanus]